MTILISMTLYSTLNLACLTKLFTLTKVTHYYMDAPPSYVAVVLTLGAHAQEGLRYLSCVSVRMCVCLSVITRSVNIVRFYMPSKVHKDFV